VKEVSAPKGYEWSKMDKIETRFKCDKIYIQFGLVLAQNIMSCLSETAEGGGGGGGKPTCTF
jgi:hypothetical protein